ncbi:hypothetical protein [Fontibacillus sp. BL9]|uniref:hypothetical protein n=1 Tax=Fontibacillus sp. BL9 TaxID=3389971 RepID=UPI00397DA3BB
MELKKELGLLMLLSAVLLSGCTPENSGKSVQESDVSPLNNQVTMQPEQEISRKTTESEQNNKTWSSEDDKVKITPVKLDKYGTAEVVSVEINGVKKEYNWSMAEEPRIFYCDVTGDNKPEAVIILNLGRGTDTSIDELHVLNSEDLSEIKVPDYEEIVADYIETNVAKNADGNLTIQVKVQGKDHEFNYDADPDVEVDEKLLFGGVVNYSFENQKIMARISGSIAPTGAPIYLCDFQITHKFDRLKNEIIVDQIQFESF